MLTKQNHNLREVEGHSRSAIQDSGCDREGRKTKLHKGPNNVYIEKITSKRKKNYVKKKY